MKDKRIQTGTRARGHPKTTTLQHIGSIASSKPFSFAQSPLQSPLLDTKLFPEQHYKTVNFLRFWERLGNAFLLQASLSPRDELRAFCFDAEVSTGLVCIEPGVVRDKGYVNKAQGVAPEEELVPQLPF